MKGIFTLYIQKPKSKKIGLGTIDIDKDGRAIFCNNKRVIAEMKRVRVEIAAMTGIVLSGFQFCGFDKQGNEKFIYQEWWLAYE